MPWRTLRIESLRYTLQREALEREELWKGALEQAHLALEIAMKSAIVKHGGRRLITHSLDLLAAERVRGRKLVGNTIRQSGEVMRAFAAIKTVWNMHMRYDGSEYQESEVDDFIDDFERVTKWILNKLVE